MRFSTKDQLFFVKRLSILLGAGLTLPAALRSLEDTPGLQKKLQPIARGLSRGVREGQTLAAGLRNYARVFGPAAISLVAVGEASGTLPEHLEYWHAQLMAQNKLQRKLRGALVYPIIVLSTALCIGTVLMLYVFPKLLPIFSALKFELPLATRILLWIYTAVKSAWMFLLAGSILVIFLASRVPRWPPVVRAVDALLIRLPLVSRLFRTYHSWRVCRTLAVLLQAELPVLEAARMTEDATTSVVYKKVLAEAVVAVSQGKPLSEVILRHERLFPGPIAQLVVSGEQTGRLSHALWYAGTVLEEDTNELLGRVTALFEPALLIVVGVCVGFIAIAIITPIYGITQSLHL